MRQNLVIVALSVCCTLLAVNLYVTLQLPQQPAFGQGAAIPTGHVASQRLALYTARNRGLELKGVRHITYDLRLTELDARMVNKPLPVSEVKKAVEKQGGN